MDEDLVTQKCGQCETLNATDAVVCTSCGAVLAAYAPVVEPPLEPEGAPAAPANMPDQPTRSSTSGPDRDWRALFEQPGLLSSDESPAPTPAQQVPHSADLSVRADDEAERDISPHYTDSPARQPQPPPLNRSSAPPEQRASRAAAGRPAPAGERASARSRPANARPAGRAGVEAMPTTQFGRTAANRALRTQLGAPLWTLYAGIALLLGGCVLSLLLAMVMENSTAIGFAFLCTVPIGFVLFVIGYVRLLMRREGRAPKK